MGHWNEALQKKRKLVSSIIRTIPWNYLDRSRTTTLQTPPVCESVVRDLENAELSRAPPAARIIPATSALLFNQYPGTTMPSSLCVLARIAVGRISAMTRARAGALPGGPVQRAKMP
jgi:hypothetical protein